MGSAIITPSEIGIIEEFGVSIEAASLVLSIYVIAYGTGPLIFSPLSEIPSIGRNPPYIITMTIFVILCVPTALVDNFAGLIVLRFLQGFFGSPCLATGGASMQDMYSLIKLPYILCLWAFAATCGPVRCASDASMWTHLTNCELRPWVRSFQASPFPPRPGDGPCGKFSG